jgi:hypothetical protein
MSPLTVALLAALCSVAVCQDKLYITADNKLKDVCVNGDRLPLMEQFDKVSRLDRMPLPAGWNDNGQGCITVSAHNANPRTWGGILACVKGAQLANLYWQCVEMPALAGASCCTSRDNPIWQLPSSSVIIQMAPNEHRKKNYMKKLPAMCTAVKGQTNWVWAQNRLQPDVCCRSAPCAPLCDACDTAGAEKCDEGKCRFGATGLVTPPICKSKCFVKLEIFPLTQVGFAYYPKAEITNGATGEVYKLPIANCQAAFMIDIATCRPIIDKTIHPGTVFYYGADDGPGTTSAVNGWTASSYAAWTGSFIVDLASGCPPAIGFKWLAVQRSDGAGIPVMTEIYSGGNRTASFTITGYTATMDSQDWSDVVTTPFP